MSWAVRSIAAMHTCDGCGRDIVSLELGLYHAEDGTLGCIAPDGIIHTTGAPNPGEAMCDLCGDPDPGDGYIVTGDISVLAIDGSTSQTLTQHQSVDWACCPACEADALAGRYGAIIDRVIVRLRQALPFDSDGWPEVRRQITELHAAVWSGWDGKVHHGTPPSLAD